MNDMKIAGVLKLFVCIKIHTILYFPKNDLNALNRMLTVKFKLRINWYTSKSRTNVLL